MKMRDGREHPAVIAALGVAGLLLGPYRPAVREAKHEPVEAERPPPGWWEILKRTGREISDNGLMTQAAAITFYALLSLFPAMAALVSIYGLVADPATILKQLDALSAVLPGGGQQLLADQLKTLTTASDRGLGWGLALGLATSIWTSNQAMKAMFNALNAVHDVREVRGFVRLTATTLACTAGVIVFMVVALTGVVVVPAVLSVVGLGGLTESLVKLARWPLLLLCVSALLAVLYRFGPCRSKVVWRWVSAGGLAASVLWVVVSVLFSWYVANFGSYNKTYGSLGAVVGFMTWIWISSTVVLSGAQLDAELEKSSVGRQRPRTTGSGGLAPVKEAG